MLKICMFKTSIRAEPTVSEGAFPESEALRVPTCHIVIDRATFPSTRLHLSPFHLTGNRVPFIFVDMMSEVVLF